MAWVSISNTAIDQDSPITVSLMTALRDNPIAIANGDAGAPKVQTAGINDSAVTTAKIANGNVNSDKLATGSVIMSKFPIPAAADTYTLHRWRKSYGDDRSTSRGYLVTKAGSYRINVLGDSSKTVTVRVNGTVVATLNSFTTSTEQVYDVTLAVNDNLLISTSTLYDGDNSYTVSITCSQPFPFFLLLTSGWD